MRTAGGCRETYQSCSWKALWFRPSTRLGAILASNPLLSFIGLLHESTVCSTPPTHEGVQRVCSCRIAQGVLRRFTWVSGAGLEHCYSGLLCACTPRWMENSQWAYNVTEVITLSHLFQNQQMFCLVFDFKY